MIVIAIIVALVLLFALSLVYFEIRVRRVERIVMSSVRSNGGDWIASGLISRAYGLNFSMVMIAGRRLWEAGLIDRKKEEDGDGLVMFFRTKVKS